MERLEKVDMIRERTGLSYAEAVALLDASEGDVLQALIKHEESTRTSRLGAHWETFEAKGNEVLAQIKELVKRGNVTKILVKHNGKVVGNIPATAGVIGAVVAPQLAILGSVACLLGQCSIEIQRRGEPSAEFVVGDAEPSP